MLSFCSSTCMPRSGTRWRAVALGGTSEGPSGRRGVASTRQATPESPRPREKPTTFRLVGHHGLVARGTCHLARQIAIGVRCRAAALLLDDAAARLGRLLVCAMLHDLRFEDVHLALHAVADRGDDAL